MHWEIFAMPLLHLLLGGIGVIRLVHVDQRIEARKTELLVITGVSTCQTSYKTGTGFPNRGHIQLAPGAGHQSS